MTDYPINSRISVHISHYTPAGLRGKVKDGTRAIIRNREIAWDVPPPCKYYVGKTLETVVLDYDTVNEQLELSLRLIEHDPWEDVATKYARGREVEGRVVGLISGAAFIELEPGVDALLPASEVPLNTDQHIEDWLWIHDQVKMQVIKVDPRIFTHSTGKIYSTTDLGNPPRE
jgi:small subunit ribosomal protein S1